MSLSRVSKAFAARQGKDPRTQPVKCPERDIRAAVISRAILDIYSTVKAIEQHTKRDARAWLFWSDSHADYSFFDCCEVLGLDPYDLRKIIRRDGVAIAERGILF